MLNISNWIAALITAGFWGSTTKDQDEKINHAGFARVLIFGLLSWFTFIVFVKTYQMATVGNQVNIQSFCGKYDKTGDHPVDSALVEFVFHVANDELRAEKFNYESQETIFTDSANLSGVFISINTCQNDSSGFNLNRTELAANQALSAVIIGKDFLPQDSPLKSLAQQLPDSTAHLKELSPEAQQALFFNGTSNVKYFYALNYGAPVIPSVLPWLKMDYKNRELPKLADSCDFAYSIWSPVDTSQVIPYDVAPELKQSFVRRLNLATSYSNIFFCASASDTVRNFSYFVRRPDINNFNLLTAADISQAEFSYSVYSELPVNHLKVWFDTPTEFGAISPIPDYVNEDSFGYTDQSKIKQVLNTTMRIHTRFPALESRQLIRSLLLTTILTSLVTLFVQSLILWLRHVRRRFRNIDAAALSDKHMKINVWRILYALFIAALASALFYVSWRIWNDKPFIVDYEASTKVIVVAAIAIVAATTIAIFLHRKASAQSR